MKIYLLRHGFSVANEQQLVCGAADYPLTALGMEQARRAVVQLQSIRFTHIYSSSLQRALDTAAGFVASNKLNVDPRLRELDTGEVSHITLSNLWDREPRFRKPWLSPDLRYPGGETFREMITRISGWLDQEILTWDDDSKILIVGHEGTLRTIYLKLLSVPLENYPEFPIGNCDHLVFDLKDRVVQHHEHVTLIAPGERL